MVAQSYRLRSCMNKKIKIKNTPINHLLIKDLLKRSVLTAGKNIGTQGVQEFFFCELKGFRDSRIK